MGDQGWVPGQSDAVLSIWIVAGAGGDRNLWGRLDSSSKSPTGLDYIFIRGGRGGRDGMASEITDSLQGSVQRAAGVQCSSASVRLSACPSVVDLPYPDQPHQTQQTQDPGPDRPQGRGRRRPELTFQPSARGNSLALLSLFP